MEGETGRRRENRRQIKARVGVTWKQDGKRETVSGEASDFSVRGMRLFLSREIDCGTALILEFPVPYNSAPIVVRGVVRNRNGFHYGVEFTGISSYQKQMIERACNILELLT